MANRIPPIQTAWRQYKKNWDSEQELLSFNHRVISGMELLWFLAPYILAGFWGSTFNTPVRRNVRKIRRKNRNI